MPPEPRSSGSPLGLLAHGGAGCKLRSLGPTVHAREVTSRGPGNGREMSSPARPQLVQGQALGALVSGCPWNASLLLDSFQFLKKTRLVDF